MFDFYKQSVRFACVAICAVCLSTSPLIAVDDLFLNLEPGSDVVSPGDTVTVSLFVANLSFPINGVQALMNYDPSMLSLVSITETNLGLLAPAEGWVQVHFSDNAGDIVYAIAINGSSIITTHAVATLTFTVISEGATRVSFNVGVDPFVNKITRATDSSTLLPTLTNTSLIISNCDDGLFCNGVETFDGLVCQPGTAPCIDGVACTVDSCDDVLDVCTNTPDDLFCDNVLFCDGQEFCDALLGCQLGADPCDDGVSCTVDTCDDVLDTCANTPDDLFCDNTLFCDGLEFCDALLDCQSGINPCDDAVTCTVDTCDDALDTCTNTPTDALCSNGIFCDGTETCDAVQGCLLGFDPCDDGVVCTIDTCDDVLDTCTNTPDDAFCSNGIFCDGAEVCDPALDCQASSDPCAPLVCDEINALCIAPIHVEEVQVFYADRFRVCQGGDRDGLTCFSDNACTGTSPTPNGTCTGAEQPDPSYSFLAAGSVATTTNITNYTEGITGVRVLFDNIVDFATTADAALLFEWSNAPICVGGDNDGFSCFTDNDCTGTAPTPNGTCDVLFEPVLDAINMITVTPFVENNRTVVDIVITNGHVMRRWLKVTVIATEATSGGVELDGELVGNPISVPSGDGFAGGDAVFYIGHIPADVDANRKVELTDPGLIRNCACFNPFLEALITEVHDVDKDGRVVLTDVGKARVNVNPFFTLPLISP